MVYTREILSLLFRLIFSTNPELNILFLGAYIFIIIFADRRNTLRSAICLSPSNILESLHYSNIKKQRRRGITIALTIMSKKWYILFSRRIGLTFRWTIRKGAEATNFNIANFRYAIPQAQGIHKWCEEWILPCRYYDNFCTGATIFFFFFKFAMSGYGYNHLPNIRSS